MCKTLLHIFIQNVNEFFLIIRKFQKSRISKIVNAVFTIFQNILFFKVIT